MVDRIVPHFSMAELKEKEKAWGYFDPVAIFTEDFAQWIIEDNFGGHKPNWQSAGVQFVKDVKPFERIKLQVLNASHSWLAYRGLLKGHEFVADCMADQELSSELSEMINSEIGPLLDIPTGFDLLEYKDQMFGRFRNPSMRHRLSQIAMDGTQKIPQRFTPNLSAQSPLLLKGLAAWLKYIQKNNYQDPQKDKLDQVKNSSNFMSILKDFKLLPQALQHDDQIKAILEKELLKL
jgi:fructuronate reductase